MRLKKKDTIQLILSFKDKKGNAIDLSGHTVRIISYNLYDYSELFNKGVTSFSGDENNTCVFTFPYSITSEWVPMLYNWYLQIETSRGERFSSAPMRLEVSKDLETEADHILIFGGDNIVCTIEDDVSLSDSGPAQNQLVFGNQEIVYNSELILY